MTKKKFNLTEWTPQPQQRESAPSVPVAVPQNLQDSDIEIVTQRIEAAGIDITANYQDWLDLGFALAGELGEAGRSYFQRLSRFYPGYDEHEADKKFSSCMATGSGKVNISTFFHLAQQAGVSVSIKRQSVTPPPTPPVAKMAVAAEDPPEPMPTFSDLVKGDLPDFLQRIVSFSNSAMDADLLILGTVTVISACLPNFSGVYDRRRVYANLYLFVTAQASAGKGRLALCKNIIMPIHEKLREEYARLKATYDEEMTAFLKSSRKEGLSRPKEVAMKTLIMPANSSATAMCQTLNDNDGVGLMFETEGDTLATTFKSEHGNYSDALRKAFHHESISYNRRKDREFVELKIPRLSAVLSGTPRQVLSLIPDAENGLFSRFIFYSIDVALVWNDVFAGSSDKTMEECFDELGKRFDYLYTQMQAAEPMTFRFTTPQEQEFNDFFRSVQTKYAQLYGLDIVGSIRRLGLITYRIAMVMTALRFMENVPMQQIVFCSETDFQNALSMVQVLLKHTAKVFESLPISAAVSALSEKTEAKQAFYDQLPQDFSRETYLTLAQKLNIPQRSAERYIQTFCKEGKLVRAFHGQYRKP